MSIYLCASDIVDRKLIRENLEALTQECQEILFLFLGLLFKNYKSIKLKQASTESWKKYLPYHIFS